MIEIRKANERGHFNHGWLDTYHTFSFAGYYDPKHVQFRTLRVINEDRVEAGSGFGTHPHRDMEIISYVLSGALGHRDSMGHSQGIEPGEVQVMTAGSGITHSEYNHSETETTHFLQIWLMPKEKGLTPRYDQKRFSDDEKRNTLKLIVSGDGREGSLMINQDADLYATLLEPGNSVEHRLVPGRGGWLQVIRGKVDLNGIALAAGDGAAIEEEQFVRISAEDNAEVLLFDLA